MAFLVRLGTFISLILTPLQQHTPPRQPLPRFDQSLMQVLFHVALVFCQQRRHNFCNWEGVDKLHHAAHVGRHSHEWQSH